MLSDLELYSARAGIWEISKCTHSAIGTIPDFQSRSEIDTDKSIQVSLIISAPTQLYDNRSLPLLYDECHRFQSEGLVGPGGGGVLGATRGFVSNAIYKGLNRDLINQIWIPHCTTTNFLCVCRNMTILLQPMAVFKLHLNVDCRTIVTVIKIRNHIFNILEWTFASMCAGVGGAVQ